MMGTLRCAPLLCAVMVPAALGACDSAPGRAGPARTGAGASAEAAPDDPATTAAAPAAAGGSGSAEAGGVGAGATPPPGAGAAAGGGGSAADGDGASVGPVDLLGFAAGVVPVAVDGPGVQLGVGFEQAISAIDGSPVGRVLNRRPADAGTWVELTYMLPAATTFDTFAVPNVLETPSPSQTFVRDVTISGAEAQAGPWTPLGQSTLATHASAGQRTPIPVSEPRAVRYVKVRLAGGIEAGATFLELSEIVGHGRQETVPRVDHFTGTWRPQPGQLRLRQEGATVVGCADNGRRTLRGTVTGNVLLATLRDDAGVGSSLIAVLAPDGGIVAVRSDNGGPFRFYAGPADRDPARRASCDGVEDPPSLGCGSVIHGIRFGFDSAQILPSSEPVLAALHEGLAADTSARVVIEGHTSTEGSDDYNQRLSQRRADAVVADLARRGIPRSRLTATGRGESRPIAPEDSEAGRALNRRVEVHCGS